MGLQNLGVMDWFWIFGKVLLALGIIAGAIFIVSVFSSAAWLTLGSFWRNNRTASVLIVVIGLLLIFGVIYR